MLTISVKNFGPIAEGSVDLKPLTIFVGPSNTGKSYMATAVYAVMRGFQGSNLIPPKHRSSMSRWERMGYSTESLPWTEFWEWPDDDSTVGKAIYLWGKRLQEQGEPETLTVADMPEKVRLELERVTFEALSELRQDVREQLSQAFREPVSRIDSSGSYRLTVERDEPPLSIEFSLENGQKALPKFNISQTEIVPSPLALTEFSHSYAVHEDWEEPILVPEVFDAWCQSVAQTLTDAVPDESYYLPAARSGIFQGHKILVTELVRQSSSKSRQRVSPTLPGITTQFLGNLISLDRRMRGRPRTAELENAISFIESNVLHGEIDLDESASLPYPEIAYNTVAGKFTLEHSSSMVSELAPLILFLKYLVSPGDLLILEEPESHLHPAAQRQLARGIVRLVNAGCSKVLITTHSDIIVSQINNLLALRQARQELIESGGFGPEDFLQPDQVGAYLFRHSQERGGCETMPLEIDPDTGIDEDEFATVSSRPYTTSP